MELTHIEHLGIAVKSIEACLPYYEGVLGLKCYNIEVVADQKVKTAFFKVGQTKIDPVTSATPSLMCFMAVIRFLHTKLAQAKPTKWRHPPWKQNGWDCARKAFLSCPIT